MAFNLTANINARLANGGTVAAQLRKQLSANPIAIDVKLSGTAAKASRQLTDSLKGLNAQLRAVSANSRTASSAINQLAASFTKFKSGTSNLIQTANAAKRIKKETKEATDQVAEFGRVSGLALRRNTGFLLATGAVYGLGRAITSSFGEAVRFEKELVKIAQVSNRSVASLKPLADEITRLSTSLGVASSDLVDVSLILAQAGLSANETRQALDALAKTTLAATFGSIQDTTEGAIALMAQFEIGAKDLGKALGATNAVSAAFAVESEDIIAAVKRAGGVFAQTSKGVTSSLGAFNEFIAVFSAVRATTRESAESIATGLRTIFTRIQRPATIQFLKELGVELTDLNGRFVGPFEAVNRLSKGLEGLDRRGSSFARVAEELGGFRQIGKTLALLSSSTQRIQALQVAQQGQNSVNKDAEQAQQSLANAIQKTREEFTALIREIAGTKSFDTIVRSVLGLANAFIKIADAIKPVIPLLAVLGTIKGIGIASSFLPAFKKSLGGKGFAVGGRVTGGKGGVDDIPAMLTAGEYVINKKSANMIGKQKLDKLNAVGLATGGPVGRVNMQAGGDAEEELEKLRKLDAKLGKNQGAQKERARLLKSIEAKAAIRNERVSQLFTGGTTPRFEATVGGQTVSANSGQNLAGELGDVRRQNRQTGPANQDFNKTQELTKQEAIERQKLVEAIKKQTIAENKKANAAQVVIPSRSNRAPTIFRPTNEQRRASLATEDSIQSILNQKEEKKARLRQDASGRFVPVIERTKGVLTQEQLIREENNKLINNPDNNLVTQEDLFSRRRVRPSSSRFEDIRDSERAALGRPDFTSTRKTARQRLSSTINRSSTLRALGFGRSGLGGINGIPELGEDGQPTGKTIPKTIGGKLRNFSRSNRARIAGGSALAGGLILGDQIGGKTGSAITSGTGGAFTGAAIGSVIPGIGTAAGAAIGGIIGALNGLIQADLDEKIKAASDSMIKSIGSVEDAFTTFTGSESLSEIQKKLPQLNQSFSEIGSSVIAGGTNKFNEINTTGARFSRTFAGFGREVDGRRILAARDEQRGAINKDAFTTTKSDLSTSSQSAKLLLDSLTGKGVDFDSAVKKLDPNAIIALAVGNAKDGSAEAKSLGQAITGGDKGELERRARSQVLGGSLRTETEEREKQNEILKKAQNELANVNSETDLFVARMGNLSAVLDRASQSGEGFRRSNEALLSRRGGGAGIRSQQTTNVFDNTAGFTQGEVTKEALRINAFLGNNANSREATQGVIGAKQLQTKLPALLNSLSVGVRGGAESETLLPELINKNLSGLPEVLRNKLQSDIRTKFFANEQASPDDVANALAGGDVTDIQGSAQEVNGIFKKLVDVTNQKIGEYEQVLDTFIQLNREANDAQDNRLQILNESANQEKALLGQQRLTVGDRSRGFNTQLGQFAGRAGSTGSVQDLINRESALNSARAGSFSGAPDEVARQMARLTEQQSESLRALELIAGNTERQNAITEELNSLIDSRREARQVFEDFASGSPTEKREIERNIDLARRQNDGETFFGSRLKQASEGQRALQAIIGATQGPDALKELDQKRINFLDRSGADRLFGAAGVNPGVGIGGLLNNNDSLFQGQFAQLQDLNRQRGAAAAGIEGINRRDSNQFEQNGRDSFNSFQTNLQAALAKGGTLDALNATLASLPETFTIGGTVNHNININGGEVLAAMDPAIRKLVATHVDFEINRRMNPLTGETGPA